MFRDADVDLTFGAVELRSCFQQVERCDLIAAALAAPPVAW